MLVLGHAGITLGIAVLLYRPFYNSSSLPVGGSGEKQNLAPSAEDPSNQYGTVAGKLSRISSLARRIDIRVLLVGSLLSDIIDKPLGHLFLQDTISNGRIFSHTLLSLILIMFVGIYQYRKRGGTGLLAISFGTLTHLVLDQMWRTPRTLFWPVYGFTFDRMDLTNWIPNILHALVTDPQVYVPELAGTVILGWFTLALVRQRKAFSVLKYGQLS